MCLKHKGNYRVKLILKFCYAVLKHAVLPNSYKDLAVIIRIIVSLNYHIFGEYSDIKINWSTLLYPAKRNDTVLPKRNVDVCLCLFFLSGDGSWDAKKIKNAHTVSFNS